MTPKKIMSVLLLGIAMTLVTHRVNATALSYETVDVPDMIVGVDRLKYIYHLDGTFATFYGFNLIYDSAHYADLDVVVPLDPSLWFSSITAPDPLVPLDGLLSYMALADIADASTTFEVEFSRTGTGPPGSQPYELFDDSFNIIASSRTTTLATNVPEPPTLSIMFAGLFLLLRLVMRRPVRSTAEPGSASLGANLLPLSAVSGSALC